MKRPNLERIARQRQLLAALCITTQEQCNEACDALMEGAIALEEKRDACVHESKEYWLWHDRALALHEQAELLMA